MNPELSEQAVETIESLCKLGCTEVNRIIDDARNGSDITELNAFTERETRLIIDELKEIMAVYDKADPC